MKKWTGYIVMAFIFLVSVSGWSKDYKVGVAWYGKSGMADTVAKGLEESIKASIPGVQLECHPSLKDAEELDGVVKQFQQDKDAMVILRSNGAQYLIENPPTIPTFIGACNNPVDLGVIKNLKSPEGNITGVTYSLSVETQFETFRAIVPKIKSMVLLLEEGHPSSAIDQAGTKELCKKLKIEYQEKFCKVYKNKEGKVDDETRQKTFQEVTAAVEEFKGKVSIIVLGNQALFIDNAKVVMDAAGKTPVLAYSAKSVKDGALCGLSADDLKLGRMLGDSIAEVLVKGKAIKEVPVKVDLKPQLYINVKTAEALKLEIPYEILSVAKCEGVEKM